MSFDETIQVVHKEILDKHKMSPKWNAQVNIPLCKMISILVVHHALKIDVLKMEQAFQTNDREGDKVFYVSPLN
jgi:hypothetical protein